jgi:hypothetical protein
MFNGLSPQFSSEQAGGKTYMSNKQKKEAGIIAFRLSWWVVSPFTE